MAMWEAIPAQPFDSRLFPSACIRVSGAKISDLQNSRESPNTSNCGIPKPCRKLGVLRNCRTHEHIGMAASHGTGQFRSNPLPSKGFWGRGLSRHKGQGRGNKPSRRSVDLERDGWGRVHTATRPRVKQTGMSLLST